MAALRAPTPNLLAAFLPVARAQLLPRLPSQPITTKRLPLLHRLRNSLLPAALVPIPGILEELWEGVLRAVPKKKTSHMKKRHRQMASGKGLKDVTALNKCSACGRPKRAHVLCPYCVQSIRRWFGNGFKTQREVEQEDEKMFEVYNKELRIMGKRPLERPKGKVAEGKEGEEEEEELEEDVTNTQNTQKDDPQIEEESAPSATNTQKSDPQVEEESAPSATNTQKSDPQVEEESAPRATSTEKKIA